MTILALSRREAVRQFLSFYARRYAEYAFKVSARIAGTVSIIFSFVMNAPVFNES